MMASFKPGARVSCSDDEFYEEFMMRPDRQWEKLTDYTREHEPFGHVSLLQQHVLSEIPTDLERVAIHVLKRMAGFCKNTKVIESIEKTLADPSYLFDWQSFHDPQNKGSNTFRNAFDKFEAEYRNARWADWQAYYFMQDVAMYRRLGRPHPCPEKAENIGGMADVESRGGFLTVAIVENLETVNNILAVREEEE